MTRLDCQHVELIRENFLKLLLIYNPAAGGGKARELQTPIVNYFTEKGIEMDLLVTQYSGHAIEMAESANLDDYQAIVAAGGDGTIFEVLNGYYRNTCVKKPVFGILPNGTGNAFCRELNFYGEDWKKAIDLIIQGHTKKIDVARFTTENKLYYSLNMLGLGFVSDVNESSIKLKFLGNQAYVLAVFQRLFKLKSYRLKLTLEQETEQVIERDNVFVEIANSRYTGKTFLMAPDAKLDDGLLDVVLLNKISRFKILRLFPTIFTGKHIQYPEIEVFQAKKIRVETEPRQILTPDGELFGSTPLEVECLKQDLQVFWI